MVFYGGSKNAIERGMVVRSKVFMTNARAAFKARIAEIRGDSPPSNGIIGPDAVSLRDLDLNTDGIEVLSYEGTAVYTISTRPTAGPQYRPIFTYIIRNGSSCTMNVKTRASGQVFITWERDE